MNLLRILLLLFTLSLFGTIPELSAAPKKTIRASWYSGRKYVSMSDTAAYYGMKMKISGNTITFYSKYSRIIFDTKKRAGSINGVRVNWFYVPVKKSNSWYFSEYDLLL